MNSVERQKVIPSKASGYPRSRCCFCLYQRGCLHGIHKANCLPCAFKQLMPAYSRSLIRHRERCRSLVAALLGMTGQVAALLGMTGQVAALLGMTGQVAALLGMTLMRCSTLRALGAALYASLLSSCCRTEG